MLNPEFGFGRISRMHPVWVRTDRNVTDGDDHTPPNSCHTSNCVSVVPKSYMRVNKHDCFSGVFDGSQFKHCFLPPPTPSVLKHTLLCLAPALPDEAGTD